MQFGLYYPRVYSQNEIYDIGTEILLLTKNDHNSTQKAPKSIIPEDFKSAGHFPSSDSVKSRFKALFEKWPSWIRRCCFHGFLPPEGDLTKKLYRHKVKDFLIKISFGICSKQLSTMKNRFLILPSFILISFWGLKSWKRSKNNNVPKNVENQFCNMLSYVKKCGENGYTIS